MFTHMISGRWHMGAVIPKFRQCSGAGRVGITPVGLGSGLGTSDFNKPSG